MRSPKSPLSIWAIGWPATTESPSSTNNLTSRPWRLGLTLTRRKASSWPLAVTTPGRLPSRDGTV